ncbi:DUF4012 domain-containing protein [Patescibacteria group bacterium]|nr:DUF4012 domain-containing protein [Patescibacteria group bacterium]MCL5091624.1 DUF4012 domain-containing protein [Patescibacteria group bacterium]
MSLITEIKNQRQKILIVDRQRSFLASLLRSTFIRYDFDVYLSSQPPTHLDQFQHCFLINETNLALATKTAAGVKITYLYLNRPQPAERLIKHLRHHHGRHIKVVNLVGDEAYIKDNWENLLWFVFSKSEENVLHLRQYLKKPVPRAPHSSRFVFLLGSLYQTVRKRYLWLLLVLLLIWQCGFIVPLSVMGLQFYQTYRRFQTNPRSNLKTNLTAVRRSLDWTKSLYGYARPTWLLFSLANLPDSIIQVSEKTLTVADQLSGLARDGQRILAVILKTDHDAAESLWVGKTIGDLPNRIDQINEDLRYIQQKLPDRPRFFARGKTEINQTIALLNQTETMLPALPKILAQNGEKKYLLLFANNMELRPGGGFIGSFAVVTVKNFGLESWHVYDVYDADGQLTAHLDPPEAIKTYLRQPHWFLRDSAFAPDWPENYRQATVFLAKEMGWDTFDGGMLMTTTALQTLLQAYGNLYLSDFNEVVNADNFYLKAQLYSEKNFFPGSTQKKSFLTALVNQLLIGTETASPQAVLLKLKQSLDEKQLVLYFDDQSVQTLFDKFYWAGRVIEPSCPKNIDHCINNYLFPFDANLGVNKANFFVNRFQEVKTVITPDGTIKVRLRNRLKNNSQNDVFPGGAYVDYFQLLLPSDAVITQVSRNGVLDEDYSVTTGQYQTIALFLTVPPQNQTTIEVDYQLNASIPAGKSVYQLLMQKQIGSSNNDVSFVIQLPSNVALLNQNFSPLVENNQILYNTTLSADKIFFLELSKQ